MTDTGKTKRILITNIVSLNPGDAAILQGMFQILPQRYGVGTQIVVFDRSAEVAAKYYPWASFRQSFFAHKPTNFVAKKLDRYGYGHWNTRLRYWLLRACVTCMRSGLMAIPRIILRREDYFSLREYCYADVVISTGGTYLVENYNLWPAIYDFRLTLAAGRPLVFFTQSLGPYHIPKYRTALKDIFNRAYRIFVRDNKSQENLAELGVGGAKVVLAKDAAFVLQQNDSLEPSPDHTAKSKSLKLAVSVRDLQFFDKGNSEIKIRYDSSILAMVEYAVRSFKAEVTFLSTCQGIKEYWTNDADYARQLIAKLPLDIRPHVDLDEAFRQPLDIVSAYQQFDLVIATRMHAAILALVAGTPVLGIAYEFKLEELFGQLGMDDALLSTKTINPDSSRESLEKMLISLEHRRSKVISVIEVCRREAASVNDQLPDL